MHTETELPHLRTQSFTTICGNWQAINTFVFYSNDTYGRYCSTDYITTRDSLAFKLQPEFNLNLLTSLNNIIKTLPTIEFSLIFEKV